MGFRLHHIVGLTFVIMLTNACASFSKESEDLLHCNDEVCEQIVVWFDQYVTESIAAPPVEFEIVTSRMVVDAPSTQSFESDFVVFLRSDMYVPGGAGAVADSEFLLVGCLESCQAFGPYPGQVGTVSSSEEAARLSQLGLERHPFVFGLPAYAAVEREAATPWFGAQDLLLTDLAIENLDVRTYDPEMASGPGVSVRGWLSGATCSASRLVAESGETGQNASAGYSTRSYAAMGVARSFAQASNSWARVHTRVP